MLSWTAVPLAFCIFAIAPWRAGFAWRTTGTLKPYEGTRFAYVGKFCFDYIGPRTAAGETSGSLEVEIIGHVEGGNRTGERPKDDSRVPTGVPLFPVAPSGGLYLAIFSDAEDQWPAVREQWDNMSAAQLLQRAAGVRAVTPLLPAGKFSAQVHVQETNRPRFLYFVFVFWDTAITDSVPVTYKIHCMNSLAGYEKEFSVDEFGATRLHCFGFLAFGSVLVLVHYLATLSLGVPALWSRPLLSLLLISCALSAVDCACRLVHETAYADDGVGKGGFLVLGELFAAAARLLLSVLQLYIATGKALLQSAEQRARRTYVSFLVVGIVVASLGCEVYARFFGDLDWSTTLYFYASWPGFLILTFNSALFVEVCRSTFQLYQLPESSERIQRFYVLSFSSAAIYFAALPATCILAHLLNPWDRKRVVIRTELVVRFVATLILLYILRPSRLDSMISARMETSDKRDRAIELADQITELS